MGNNGSSTYSQRLTPEQIQVIFDQLAIPWREQQPSEKGWINIPDYEFIEAVHGAGFNHVSFVKPAFNIKNGGYIDQWFSGLLNSADIDLDDIDPDDYQTDATTLKEKKSLKGDVVDLVNLFLFKNEQSQQSAAKSIEWINNLLGIGGKPELRPDQLFAKEFISGKQGNYSMIPNVILKSNEISASAKLVWCIIQERCGRGKNYSFPSISTISEDTSLGRSTVQRSLNDLKEAGYLVEAPRGSRKSPKRFPICKIDSVD